MLVLLLAVCHGRAEDAATNTSSSASLEYWEKTKELYAQTLAQGGKLLAADTNALEQIVRYLYDRAKATGDQAPAEVMDWALEDLNRIGAWEYRVLELETNDTRAIEMELNLLGASRWECFWVEQTSAGRRFYLKKEGRSYIRAVPYGELLKLVPGGHVE